MIFQIIGWFWIITGALFFIKPEIFRNRLKKKGYKKVRNSLFLFTLLMGFLLIRGAWSVQGILAKVILIFGFIAIFKAFFILKAKAAERVYE